MAEGVGFVEVLETEEDEPVVARVLAASLKQAEDRFNAKIIETCPVSLLKQVRR
jgi:hypothetical protein